MKLLADANIPQSIIRYFTNKGDDVLDVEQEYKDIHDTEIIVIAKRESKIILTLDKDFIFLLQSEKHQIGTVVIDLKTRDVKILIKHVDELFIN